MINLVKKNLELLFWTAAVIALAAANPAAQTHFTLCIFKLAGISWCPGCGLGHSISWLLHGNVAASFKAHWLGIPALFIIFYRICCLGFGQFATFKKLKLKKHGF